MELTASSLTASGTTALRARRALVARSTIRVEGRVGSSPALDATDLEIGGSVVSGSHRPGVSPSGSPVGFVLTTGTLSASDTSWSGFVDCVRLSGGSARVSGGSVVGCETNVRVEAGVATLENLEVRESASIGLYVANGEVTVRSARFVDHAFTALSVAGGTVVLRDTVLEGGAVRGQYGVALGGPGASLTVEASRIERMVTGMLVGEHRLLDVGHLQVLDSEAQAVMVFDSGAEQTRLGRSDTERLELSTYQTGIRDWRAAAPDLEAWVDFEGRRYDDRYIATGSPSVLRLPDRDTPPWDLFLQGSGHAVVLH